jgi:hypothetical protein
MASTLSKLACLALLASFAPHKALAQDATSQPAPAASSQPAAATAPSAQQQDAQQETAATPAPGTRRVSVIDPELSMESFSIQIPATWVFDGTLVPNHGCGAADSMAIRMETPDGLTAARVLPAINWIYYDSGKSDADAGDCSMFGGAKSASDLLKSAIKLLNLEYVSDVPNDLEDIKKKFAANPNSQMHWIADKARAKVKFKINSIEMDGRISVLVLCSQSPTATFTSCSATISRSWAPVGQYDDATFEAIQKTLTLNKDWSMKRQALMERELDDSQTQKVITDPVQRMHDPKRTARLEAREIFERQRDDLFPNAAPYRDAGDPGTHPRSMIRKAPAADRVVDDWTDYAIEITPRLWDTDNTISAKDREYVWANAKGETLSTPSINDNPNGKGTGTWTLQPNATPQNPKP